MPKEQEKEAVESNGQIEKQKLQDIIELKNQKLNDLQTQLDMNNEEIMLLKKDLESSIAQAKVDREEFEMKFAELDFRTQRQIEDHQWENGKAKEQIREKRQIR